MIKYTAVPFDYLSEFFYKLSLFLKGGENRGNTRTTHNNLFPI